MLQEIISVICVIPKTFADETSDTLELIESISKCEKKVINVSDLDDVEAKTLYILPNHN